MPKNVKPLIKIFLGEKLCTVEAVSWWKYGSQVFLLRFKQLYPMSSLFCSSISCYLFLYVRSFIGSEEKNTHHEKDVRYKQQYNIKLSYFIRRDSSHFHADALSSIEGLQCLSCGEEGNKSWDTSIWSTHRIIMTSFTYISSD